MATIPSEEKVFMVSNGTNTTFGGSAATKAMQEWYTMQDVIDSTKLSGTDYVFVQANGTPEENAIELQAAYDLAGTKVDYQNATVPFIPEEFYYDDAYLDIPFESYVEYGGSPIESNVVYELLFDGVSYFASFDGVEWNFVDNIFPPGTGYTTLEILVSTITYNLVTVVAAPGKYSFDTDFIVDAEYVSIVSLTGNTDVLFTGIGTINVTANDILLKGIDTQDKPFTIATDLDLLKVENCAGGEFSFGGDATFGGNPINVSGTFIECKGGFHSFAGYGGTASGYFKRCNSKSGFGNVGSASGTFIDCVVTSDGFGVYGEASGVFINCEGPNNDVSFGGGGIASGIFTNCTGGEASFGGGFDDANLASGTFTNCIGSVRSFGGFGNASGVFSNCVGDTSSFGGVANLTGKLFYCRLMDGTFQTVSGAGRTYYCVDGNGNTNNQ